jgi:hypothetical protein
MKSRNRGLCAFGVISGNTCWTDGFAEGSVGQRRCGNWSFGGVGPAGSDHHSAERGSQMSPLRMLADGDGVVVDGDDARVGDGDAEYVSCKIAQHSLVTLAPMVDVETQGLSRAATGAIRSGHLLASMALSLPRSSLAKAM